MEDVTKECEAQIESYDGGMYGITIKHKDKRLLMVKDKNPTRLWEVNYGYKIDIDQQGNFKIFYDENTSKICKQCGRKDGD